MSLNSNTKRKFYNKNILKSIFQSNFFFICFYDELHISQFSELKKACQQHGIILRSFKNNLVLKTLQAQNWNFFKSNVFGPLVIGYSPTGVDYTDLEISQILTLIEKNPASVFLGGVAKSEIITPNRLTKFIKGPQGILNGIVSLMQLRTKLSSPLLFVNTQDRRV